MQFRPCSEHSFRPPCLISARLNRQLCRFSFNRQSCRLPLERPEVEFHRNRVVCRAVICSALILNPRFPSLENLIMTESARFVDFTPSGFLSMRIVPAPLILYLGCHGSVTCL